MNTFQVLCQLPSPLKWNDYRLWNFDISLQKPVLHLIRDHVNLFTDLGKDWSSGPPNDFDKWIPIRYALNLSLNDFDVKLYLNDQNLITNPHAKEANSTSNESVSVLKYLHTSTAFLCLRGHLLRTGVEVPSNVFRPQHTTVPFWIEVPGVELSLTLPKWNTHSTFASSRTTDFGRAGFVRVDSSFMYFSEARPDYIDRLKLDIQVECSLYFEYGMDWIYMLDRPEKSSSYLWAGSSGI